MAAQTYRIVSGEDSTLHDEPHIEGRRITVQFVNERVENRGLDPQTVADRHDLSIADVYRALAYYHDHPNEMRRVERRRHRAIADNAHLTTGPDDVREWMGYRIGADENVEPATWQYLYKLGHDIEWVGDVSELGLGVTDNEIAAYSIETDRLILTQDDDFFTELRIEDSAGILFQRDQTLTNREVGNIVDEMSRYLSQRYVDLEYVGRNWL